MMNIATFKLLFRHSITAHYCELFFPFSIFFFSLSLYPSHFSVLIHRRCFLLTVASSITSLITKKKDFLFRRVCWSELCKCALYHYFFSLYSFPFSLKNFLLDCAWMSCSKSIYVNTTSFLERNYNKRLHFFVDILIECSLFSSSSSYIRIGISCVKRRRKKKLWAQRWHLVMNGRTTMSMRRHEWI